MTATAPLRVTWIPRAKRPEWMAGMELAWPHRALVIWDPLEPDENGPGPALQRALWLALAADNALVGLPRMIGTRARGLFGWFWGLPRRAEFEMDWSPSFEAFRALVDESLYFVASFDPDAERLDAADLAFWHDQGQQPDPLFDKGQRTILRSGVDNFCLGIFSRDETELAAFRYRLRNAVESEGGTLSDGPEPSLR